MRAGTSRILVSLVLAVSAALFAPASAPAARAVSASTTIERIAGSDRYGDAVIAAQSEWTAAPDVVVVGGTDPVDLFLAQPLAGVLNAPVLLVTPTALPNSVAEYLDTAGTTRVHVIGDTTDVSNSVVTAIGSVITANDSGATVTRISSGTYTGLTAAITDAIASLPGYVPSRALVVSFADTQTIGAVRPALMAAAPLAYANGWPLLLAGTDGIGPDTTAALTASGCTTATIIVGPLTGDGVAGDIDGMGLAVESIVGPGPDGTLAAVAEWAYAGGFADPGFVGVGTYSNFINLSGACFVTGAHRGVLLGTRSNDLDPRAKEFLADHSMDTTRLVIFGGTGSVSAGVQLEIAEWAPVPDWSTLSGKVTDRSSQPIEGAEVWVYGTDGTSSHVTWLMGHATAGADGTWSIADVHTYGRTIAALSVIAEAPGRVAQSWPSGPAWPWGGDNAWVSAGGSTGGIDIALANPTQWNADRLKRVAGADRYATGIELSRQNFARAETVVIATGASFADALAASPLCGIYDAPLLLTKKDSLPAGLVSEIRRLGAKKMIIVGGTGAVSSAVESALKSQAGLTLTARLSGSDRYETAYQICDRVMQDAHLTGYSTLPIVVRGDGFADALAFSPYAYQMPAPILLVKPGDATAASRRAISTFKFNLVVAAGPVASDDAALSQLAGALDPAWGDLYYIPIAGANRYQTAALAADWWGLPMPFVGVATGLDFPDALGGGVVCGARRGALLLTPPTALSADARAVVAASVDSLWQAQIFGGTGSVGAGVQSSLLGAIPPIELSSTGLGSSCLSDGEALLPAAWRMSRDEPFGAAPRLRAARR